MTKRRRWIPIILGVLILLVFIGIGAIVAVTMWVQQNMDVQEASIRDAETSFADVRTKFAGREPLLEMSDGVARFSAVHDRTQPNPGATVETLYVLVWDPEDEQLARFSLPFWLIRMKSGPVRFSSYASGMDGGGVDLQAEDIDNYGPGVILDTTTESGDRVLVWAQ